MPAQTVTQVVMKLRKTELFKFQVDCKTGGNEAQENRYFLNFKSTVRQVVMTLRKTVLFKFQVDCKTGGNEAQENCTF